MDITQFVGHFPGHLVAITTEWGLDHAFVPNPLPPQWEFPNRLWPLLSDAKQEIGVLEGLGRNLPDPAILLKPLADREAIRSSSLEGTYASARDLLLFEMQPVKKQDDTFEVHNYSKALQHGNASELPLSSRLLRELHQILMKNVRGRDRAPGMFRTIPVGIGSGGRFIPPPAKESEICLELLEKYFHNPLPQFDPLVDCFLVHYQFEAIHPFLDGNGRVGRLLLALMLQKRCGLTKPWLYMSEFYDRHKDEYIRNLFQVSASGDWDTWMEFCLRGTLIQARETIQRCEKLLGLQKEFMERVAEAGGTVRLNKIVDDLFSYPFVTVSELPSRLSITYPTAQADVDRLVAVGILERLPNFTPKTYYASKIFNIAYEQM